eukprot:163717-Amphidinium_carterae.1
MDSKHVSELRLDVQTPKEQTAARKYNPQQLPSACPGHFCYCQSAEEAWRVGLIRGGNIRRKLKSSIPLGAMSLLHSLPWTKALVGPGYQR